MGRKKFFAKITTHFLVSKATQVQPFPETLPPLTVHFANLPLQVKSDRNDLFLSS